MGKKSGGSGSSQTQTAQPWAGAVPYMLGAGGTPGTLPEAANLYNQGRWNGDMQAATDRYRQQLAGRSGQETSAYSAGNSMLNGGYDANISPVGNTAGVSNINSQSVDPSSAWSSMGATDPQGALSSLLSGQVNTSTLDPVVQNAQRRLADTYATSTMPEIGRSATAAGQYGSSRQGIAEGLAAKGLTQAQGDIAASMYNSAYQTAQANQYGTANNLSSLGLSNAANNANRALTADTTNAANQLNTQQFNASLGLQNNAQALAGSAQNVQNRMNGLNMLGSANTLQDANYQQYLESLQAGNNYNWQNLRNYSGIVNPSSGTGGTSTTTGPSTSKNYGASVLGGAAAGAAIGSAVPVIGTGVGALAGGVMGLLS